MVGRLVQQQDIRLRCQRSGQCRATSLAARQRRRVFITVKAEITQQYLGPVWFVTGGKSRFDVIENGFEAADVRLLWQIPQRRIGLMKDLATVRLDQSCSQFEECRLTRTVTSDQANSGTGRNRHFRTIQQRGTAERQADFGKIEKRWRHGRGFTSSRVSTQARE